MNKLFIFLSLCTLSSSFAQQMPQYSQYMRNQYTINPAAAGVYDFLDVTMSGRWQWVGFGDEPRTAYLSVTSPLSKPKVRYNPALRISDGPIRNPEINTGKLKHAWGGQLIADQYGAFRKMQVAGSYALHMPVSRNYNLSFGVRLGLSNNSFLADKAKVLNVIDPSLNYTDITYSNFSSNQSSKYIMDLGTGLYLYSNKSFFGISADQLTKNYVQFGSGTANFDNRYHFTATAGYKINLNQNLTVMPSLLLKFMSPAPVSVDGSVQLEYKEWLWAGVSYRHKDALVGMVGLNISRKFKFGYSYDYSISRYTNYSSGGHEIVLGLMLGR
jgi:type IX secretion system PorP/SprF family membrane protein